MKRHPRRSDEEWLNIIHECRTSGLPDKIWCEEHHIQPSKFYYHIRRLRAKACEITERKDTLPPSRVDKWLTPQAPHRTVRAPFTHTALHNNIHF